MICTDCQAATQTQWLWKQYNKLQCKYCAARFIQNLPRVAVKLDKQEVKTARLNVLGAAIEHGHSEQEIRALAALKAMAVQPVQKKGKK
jgi:hypothetical protein